MGDFWYYKYRQNIMGQVSPELHKFGKQGNKSQALRSIHNRPEQKVQSHLKKTVFRAHKIRYNMTECTNIDYKYVRKEVGQRWK